MAKVWVLQHITCETLGTIAQSLEMRGVHAEYIQSFAGQPVPKQMGDAAGLIVMGGPMGVYEALRYPFLREEMKLIETALRDSKPVLGTCLGSQLLAAALGAEVKKGSRKEIGWYPITLTDGARSDPLCQGLEKSFMAMHWHGDIFDVPSGAVPLATSEITSCQAFRYQEKAYGFLFHMEVTEPILAGMVTTFADELHEEGIDSQAIISQAKKYLPELQKIGNRVYGRWVELVSES